MIKKGIILVATTLVVVACNSTKDTSTNTPAPQESKPASNAPQEPIKLDKNKYKLNENIIKPQPAYPKE